MNKNDYIPTLDDMVEEDYRDKIVKILNDTLVKYIDDEKTNIVENLSSYNTNNTIMVCKKIVEKNIRIKTNPIVISTEYENRDRTLFKHMPLLSKSEKIRDIKNGITIRFPFCKIELCLSGKLENPYSRQSLFLDILVTSSDGYEEFYTVDIKELEGRSYDPNEYHHIHDTDNDWQFRFVDSLFDRVRDAIKSQYGMDKYKIELFDHIFKSISLSILHIFKVIRYKLYKD